LTETISIHSLFPHPRNLEIYGHGEPDVDDLLPSIRAKGILRPLIVSPREDETYWIVDGVRRFFASVQLGIKELPCQIKSYASEDELILDIIDYNRYRRKTPRQMYMEAISLWPIFAEEARLRMLAGTLASTDARGKTSEKIAGFLGISSRQVERLKYIYDHEREFPDLVQKLDEGKSTIYRTYITMRNKEEEPRKLEEKKREILEIIESIFREEVRESLLLKYGSLPLKAFKQIDPEKVQQEISLALGQKVFTLSEIAKSIVEFVKKKYLGIDFEIAGKQETEEKIYLVFEVPRLMFEEPQIIKLPKNRFRDAEEADEWAKIYGGFLLDLREIEGEEFWFIFVKPSLYFQVESGEET